MDAYGEISCDIYLIYCRYVTSVRIENMNVCGMHCQHLSFVVTLKYTS